MDFNTRTIKSNHVNKVKFADNLGFYIFAISFDRY